MHMEHALAQQRLNVCTSGYVYENADEDTTSREIDPDDYETLAMAEKLHSVRDMAHSDWARTHILDELWLSPADEWYRYCPQHPTETFACGRQILTANGHQGVSCKDFETQIQEGCIIECCHWEMSTCC